MKEKSIYNMVFSIISASIIPIILGITIPLKAIQKESLSLIMIIIYYGILLSHYIIISIAYGKDEYSSKTALYRLSNVLKTGSLCIIELLFVLMINHSTKWILFSGVITMSLIEILLDSLGSIVELKYLLFSIKGIILIFILLSIFPWNAIIMIGIISLMIDWTSHCIGRILKNKIVLSFDFISLIMFGIFLILI